jgi:hypothetical protein
MKLYVLVPMAFFADVYGFLIFVPYVGLVLTVAHLVRRVNRNRAVVPIPVRAD